MSDVPGSPRASRLASPSWFDGRLVLGVLLVLVSVLVGAKVLSSADRSQQVWVASHDLAAGTVLAPGDLEPARVRLFANSGSYAAASSGLDGYVLRRGLGAHELLPVAALSRPDDVVAYRDVSVPVASGHAPSDLRHGDQVDVYVTPDDKTVQRAAAGRSGVDLSAPRLVMTGVAVSAVRSGGGLSSSAQDQPVVLTVVPTQVLPLVQAMAQGQIDLVRVPPKQQRAAALAPAAGDATAPLTPPAQPTPPAPTNQAP